MDANEWVPVVFGLVQMAAAFFCFQTIKFVCKICIQPFSFALPISLVLPTSVCVANICVNRHLFDPCTFSDWSLMFDYTFFNSHYDLFDPRKPLHYLFYLTWLLTFASQVLLTFHIWVSAKERLASCDQLFMLPHYGAAFIDQSIMLNRRADEEPLFDHETATAVDDHGKPRGDFGETDSLASGASGMDNSETKVRIYACATVWHETADELLQMLKSIMRMDQDQCTRRLAIQWLNVNERQADYYEFESGWTR